MSLFLAIALCFVPLVVGIILCLVCIKDFKVWYVLQALGLGVGAIVLIILVRTAIDTLGDVVSFSLYGYIGLLLSVILFALIEEAVKMVVLLFFSKNIKSLSLFVIFCLLFGCTVGSFETLMYLVTGFGDTLPRLFTAVVVHTLCALLSGFSVWASRNKLHFIRGFLMSFLLHGVYNFFASQPSFMWWFSIVTILFIIFKCRIYYSLISEKMETSLPES